MKNIFIHLFAVLCVFNAHAQMDITITNQTDLDNITIQKYKVLELINDTTLPVNQQIHDLSPLSNFDEHDVLGIRISNSLVESTQSMKHLQLIYISLVNNPLMEDLQIENTLDSLNNLWIYNCDQLKSVQLKSNSLNYYRVAIQHCDNLQSIDIDFPMAEEMIGGDPAGDVYIKNNNKLLNTTIKNQGGILNYFDFQENLKLESITIEGTKNDQVALNLVHNPELRRIHGIQSKAHSSIFISDMQYNYRFEAACDLQFGIENMFLAADTLFPPNYLDDYFRIFTNGTNTSSLDAILNYDCSTTSIAEVSNAQGTVFPNPSTGVVNVQGLEEPTAFSLMSLQGTEVMQGVVQNQKALDMSHLPKGLYFLKLENQTPVKVVLE